jgi:hypothetical protein
MPFHLKTSDIWDKPSKEWREAVSQPENQTPEWVGEFDNKFLSPKTLWAQDESGKWYHKEDVKAFIHQVRQQAIEERDEKWETAVRYNVDDEQWDRIKRAIEVLNE